MQRKNLFALFLLVSCSLLAGCADKQADSSVHSKLVLPILEECEQPAYSYFDSLPQALGVTYSVTKVDYEVRAIPKLIGYIEVQSSKHNKDQLITLVNTFTLGCYPESKTTISKNSQNTGNEFLNALTVNRRLGIRNIYVVDSESELSVFVNR